jgi:hypothetical protein
MKANAFMQTNKSANRSSPANGMRWRRGIIAWAYLAIILTIFADFLLPPRLIDDLPTWATILLTIFFVVPIFLTVLFVLTSPRLSIPKTWITRILLISSMSLSISVDMGEFPELRPYQTLIAALFLLFFGIHHLRQIHRRLLAGKP